MTAVLRREGQKTHKGKEDVKLEAETGVMRLQAKNHQGSPAATRS